MERTCTRSAYAVPHPHVRLPVVPEIGSAVDLERRQAVRKDVCAALGKRGLRPLFPLGHAPRDVKRALDGPQDLCAETDVKADPGVEGKPVLTGPRRIPIDRRQRVALLPRRPKRRDKVPEAVARGEVAHSADHRARVATTLMLRRDLDRERRESVRPAALVVQAHGSLDPFVDPRRQAVDRAVPGERDRMPMCEREVTVLVVEDELEVPEVLVEPGPMLVHDVPMLVVLGPHAGDLVVRALPEIRTFGARVDPSAHAAAAWRSASWSFAAAGPGFPSPTCFPSTSTAGITSRTEEEVNASSASLRSSTGYAPSCVL